VVAVTEPLASLDGSMTDAAPDEARSAIPAGAVLKEQPSSRAPQPAAAGDNLDVDVSKFSTWVSGYCARVNVTNSGPSS
jgi:cellulase/cellobiase CelA1